MAAVVNLIVLAGIAYLVRRRFDNSIKPYYWPALGIKVLGGISLGLVYQFYYSFGDTFLFFAEASWLADYFAKDPGGYIRSLWDESFLPADNTLTISQPRSLFYVKLLSVFAILSAKNYWISSLYLSLLSFISSFWFFSVVVKRLNVTMWMAALAILFFPTVVFWSSGIIKESVASAALFALSAFFIKKSQGDQFRIGHWVVVLLSLWLLWSLKYYWSALFIPIAATSLLVNRVQSSIQLSQFKTISLWVVMYFIITVGVSFLHPNFHLNRLLDVIVQNNEAYNLISQPEDLIYYHDLQPTWSSMMLNSPWALLSGLFRPFIWEVDSFMALIVSLEGIILFLLFAGQLYRIKQLKFSNVHLLVFSVFCYSILLCTFLALSTPNLGSLSRYKVGFMPYLLIVLMYGNPILKFLTKRLLDDRLIG
ncbi:MAG: hypothetical protein HC811_09460 [Flammeovirgaceae bacterium]|nr:hypothetical protein [Flammeovirgaceae bacterium]